MEHIVQNSTSPSCFSNFVKFSFGKEETAGKEAVNKALRLFILKAAQLKTFSCGRRMQRMNSKIL